MDSKERIIEVTTELIREKGDRLHEITVREICRRADVGVGLVNYYFASKDHLIETCVERIVNGIVDVFRTMEAATRQMAPFERLEMLGRRTFTFLFEHCALSRISILGDMRSPRVDDNTHRTYAAYLPLVAACRPDWDEKTAQRRTFDLIAAMQQAFLRADVIREQTGVDLVKEADRNAFHTRVLRDLLGEAQ